MRCSWGWKKETLEASGKLDQLYNLVPDFFRPEKPGVYTYPLNGDTSQDCVLSPLLPHSAHTPPAQSHPPILYMLCLLALLLCHTQHSKPVFGNLHLEDHRISNPTVQTELVNFFSGHFTLLHLLL